jgi:hypothetical protein
MDSLTLVVVGNCQQTGDENACQKKHSQYKGIPAWEPYLEQKA